MSERLITRSLTEEKIQLMQKALSFSTKAAVIRLCVAISMKDTNDPRLIYQNEMNDNSGLNYHKSTIFPDDVEIIKALMSIQLNYKLSEEEFFPSLVKAHLERGINMIYSKIINVSNIEQIYGFLIELIGDDNDISR